MIELKKFSNNTLYDNINVKFNQGINILIGDNGCGKSTLINYIFNLHDDYTGEILINGHNIKKVDSKSDIAIVFQNPYLQFIGYDVLDEISYYYEQHPEYENQTLRIMDQLDFDNKPLNQLSGGEAQILNMYKSIYTNAKVIIIDEALSNIDTQNKEQLIKQLKVRDLCVILITNNIADYIYADNMYIMNKKKIIPYNDTPLIPKHIVNGNKKGYQYGKYQFRYGYNLITGPSAVGKSYLLNQIYIKNKAEFRIIKQYPFAQIYFTDFNEVMIKHKVIKSDFLKLMDSLELDHMLIYKCATALSTGELTLLFLVLYYLLEAYYYLFDEVIELVDPKRRSIVLKLFSKRNVIFITHNINLFNDYPINIVEVKNEV